MTKASYEVGELVMVTGGEWEGCAGVVSWPVTESQAGYVLVCSSSRVAGLKLTNKDIKPADETCRGFTQLTYHLLKLSSHVVEKSVLQNSRAGS